MTQVTLEEINKNVIKLQKELDEIRNFLHEDFELTDEVKKEIEESKKRPISEFINHKEIMKEFTWMAYEINWDPIARKFLRKLPKEIASRIVKKVDAAKENLERHLESLVSRKDYKLRVGDYRLFVDLNQNSKEAFIRTIRHRRDAYKKTNWIYLNNLFWV